MDEREELQLAGLLPFDGDVVRIRALERIRELYSFDDVDSEIIDHVLSFL